MTIGSTWSCARSSSASLPSVRTSRPPSWLAHTARWPPSRKPSPPNMRFSSTMPCSEISSRTRSASSSSYAMGGVWPTVPTTGSRGRVVRGTRFGAHELVSDQVHRTVDPRHRRTGPQAAQGPRRARPGGLRSRRHHRRRDLRAHRHGGGVELGTGARAQLPIAAIACGLAGLCYAEFASTVPVAGSAYTFSYATLGELIAWIIGWDLVLEFTIGSAALASGFSGYLQEVLDSFGITLPTVDLVGRRRLRRPPRDRDLAAGDVGADPRHQVLQPLQPGGRGDQADRGRHRDRRRHHSRSTPATGCRSSPSRSRSPTPRAASVSSR